MLIDALALGFNALAITTGIILGVVISGLISGWLVDKCSKMELEE